MLAKPNYDKLLSLFDADALSAIDSMVEAKDFLAAIRREIAVLGPGIVKLLDGAGIKIRSVGARERVHEMSESLKKLGQKVQPGVLGLFVPSDRALYILDPAPGCVVHELSHAWDMCMLSDPLPPDFDVATATMTDWLKLAPYRTARDKEFAKSLVGNRLPPSSYGGSNLQEFWAESGRAYCNVNDSGSLWDELSAPKMRACNRDSFRFVMQQFHHYNGRRFEKWRHYEGD